MIVIMEPGATPEQIAAVQKRVEEFGFSTKLAPGAERMVIGIVGVPLPDTLKEALERLPGVEQVVRISKRYKLVSRDFHPVNSVIRVGDVAIGGDDVVVIAGPCSVESEEQIITTARAVKAAGAKLLRGGAFKPRTSPYDFRGLGEKGLKLLAKAREETGLPVVTEVLSPNEVDLVAEYADVLQIGARNCQNYLLLEAVGRTHKPVLFKRGMAVQLEEWLLAAEYIAAQGNDQIILCERGIRTFETYTRNTLDLAAVPAIKRLSHLPIIVDPSHGTGRWQLVPAMMLAAVAAGADGLIVEVHPNPDQALSDGSQSLTFENFATVMPQLARVAEAIGRRLPLPETTSEYAMMAPAE